LVFARIRGEIMKAHNKVGCIVAMGGIATVFASGCGSIVNPQAKEALFQTLGNTSFTVFPTFVRALDTSYDEDAAREIGEFLTGEDLGDVALSTENVPIIGSWGMNQAKMLRESAEDFAGYVRDHPIETEYALLAEYLILGTGIPGGIHCYVLDAQGRVAHVVLLNSHWSAFADADPQTVEDCTGVLIEVLRDDLKPN